MFRKKVFNVTYFLVDPEGKLYEDMSEAWVAANGTWEAEKFIECKFGNLARNIGARLIDGLVFETKFEIEACFVKS